MRCFVTTGSNKEAIYYSQNMLMALYANGTK